MRRRTTLAVVVVLMVAVVGGCAGRNALGRTRPDLAALVSFDDGPFGFAKTYTTGKVGPFTVGESRAATIKRLQNIRLLEQDRSQIQERSPSWRLAIPAKSGGYAIYTLHFENERITSVKAFYSAFAGL